MQKKISKILHALNRKTERIKMDFCSYFRMKENCSKCSMFSFETLKKNIKLFMKKRKKYICYNIKKWIQKNERIKINSYFRM